MVRPGWYTDPADARNKRWFDGERWAPLSAPPGAARPVWNPLPEDAPPPGGARVEHDEEAPGGGLRSRRARAAVAAAVVFALAAAVAVLRSGGQSAPPAVDDACGDVETLLAGRVSGRALPDRDPAGLLVEGLGGGQDRDDGGVPDMPRGMTGRLEVTPRDWAERRWPAVGGRSWDSGQLVQRFGSPSEAQRYDAAVLRALCRDEGVAVEAHSVGSTGVRTRWWVPAEAGQGTETPSSTSPPRLAAVAVSEVVGQYRVLTWAEAPEGGTVPAGAVDVLAYEAGRVLRR